MRDPFHIAMPRILEYAKVHESVDLFLIEDQTHLWISCQEIVGDKGVFWSVPRELATAAKPKDVINDVTERLRELRSDRSDLLHLITMWPTGWQFWGIGVPEKVADYFCGSEFREAAQELRMNHHRN